LHSNRICIGLFTSTLNLTYRVNCNQNTMESHVSVVKFNISHSFVSQLYDMASSLMNVNPKPEQLRAFKVRYADADRMRDQMDEAFSVIMTVIEDKDKSDIETKYSAFYEKYYSIKTMYEDLFSRSTTQTQIGKSNGMESTRFHLPKIELVKFKGTHTEWPNFIAIYNSLIHNNAELSVVQKFHYLLTVLEYEPLSLVRHLPISNENYMIAYSLLQERYENKRLIASKHLELLLAASCHTLMHKNLRKFVNTLKENTQALKALGFDTVSWSFLLFHLMSRKMPTELRTKFEFTLKVNELPDFENLLDFLENHLRVLEASQNVLVKGTSSDVPTTLHVAQQSTCICCGGSHPIYHCQKFNSIDDKKSYIKSKNLCYNCLRPHHVSKCMSKSHCQVCGGKHHTKLHTAEATSSTSRAIVSPKVDMQTYNENIPTGSTNQSLNNIMNTHMLSSQPSYDADGKPILLNVEPMSTGLLGTALVGVQDASGHVHVVRSLIDPGAQISLMTECLAQQLRLQRRRSCDVVGVGEQRQATCGKVDCHITSLLDSQHHGLSTEAIVMKRITGYQPATQVNSLVPNSCRDLALADSTFHIPGRIDLLIGVDLFDEIFTGDKRKLGEGLPTAHSTIFGWVVMGHSPVTSRGYQNAHLVSSNSRLELALNRFWADEEAPATPILDPEDIACEKHFVDTHSRDTSGKFIVRLPFKVEHKQLGETRPAALKRFHNLERKLMKEPRLRELYVEFMRDYKEAGHMQLRSSGTIGERCYIPHHGVLKESSTTRLRAVYDASLASSTGVSLNQNLMSGPKLQQNVQDVILRFRLHPVVFTCDIKQMYRNVRLHPEDWRYQTIFWRESPDEPLQEFELTTVTYGVSSSAFQAIRVVHELANLNSELYPEASRVLREDTFVDDIVSGSDTIESARVLQHQLVDVLGQGCFHLRKWSSNKTEILNEFPSDHRETPYRFEDSGDNIFKILGIEWNPSSDDFLYRVAEMSRTITKRGILSDIARLYDPCGFITPVTFAAKAFMQKLWLFDLSWDDPIPADSQEYWSKFIKDFQALHRVRIRRYVLSEQPYECHIHGFSDASERGYAACVYLLVITEDNSSVHLLMSRSRVAPVKQKLTIPRMELCGAVLLSRLLEHVLRILTAKIKIDSTTAWCDSSIVLSWLQMAPHKLQTYEGNRVSQIQGMIPDVPWMHVPSALNPADSASRGLLPSELLNHNLWWGPEWLKDFASVAAHSARTVAQLHDYSPAAALTAQAVEQPYNDPPAAGNACHSVEEPWLITRFSSFSKLQTTVGWCLRFINNVRQPTQKTKGYLTVCELNTALLVVVKLAQSAAFHDTIKALRENRAPKTRILRLNPFIDDDGLLRVGGRLVNSRLTYTHKHPLLLPHAQHLTHLLIDHYHLLHGHAGADTLLTVIHRRFWILSARKVVRHRIFKCQRCYRLKAKPLTPFMGNLPASRVTQAKPFQKVGVDFAGPFTVRASHMRTPRTYKAYLCVLICFASKAVHLEVVSALSTDAFLACLDRFVSRRGLPSDIFSDCGTNFVGARNHLKQIYQNFDETQLQQKLAPQQITWHFNPPSGPHLGGLWESAVKSAKTLLTRIIGERVLTFEELTTVFTKVEAIINSRPLCPLSSDPNNFDVLTPAHFLIGRPLLCVPEHNVEQAPVSRLSRWQLLQQITQHLWKRWHSEYLHTLQQRHKWLTPTPNLQLGELVLLIEPNTTPLQWRRARVSKLCPGSDGIVRVVEIQTSTGTFMRPVVKLCPLLNAN
jgi:hypothetical protein